MAGALLLPAAMQNDPSAQPEATPRACPRSADRRLPHIPLGSWFVSEITPAAPNARAELRHRPPNTQPCIMTPHTAGHRIHIERGTGGLIGSYASPGANRLRDPAGPSSEASRTQCQIRSRAALREIGALNWSFLISSE